MKVARYLIMMTLMCLANTVGYASIANMYFGNADAGTHDGSNCANQKVYTQYSVAGNWGPSAGLIGAGTTIHVCGTITLPLNVGVAFAAQGSGTAQTPITHIWEPGAVITGPAFGS